MRTPDLNKALHLLEAIHKKSPAHHPEIISGNVVLYGAGNLGRLALQYLKHVDVYVEFVIDRAATTGTLLDAEVTVYTPSDAPRRFDLPVLVTTVSAPFSLIYRQLKDWGWQQVLPFYDYAQNFSTQHPINNGWFSGDFSADDQAGTKSVLMSLADVHSRAAYLQFLAWRSLRQDWIYDDAAVTPNDRYFITPVLDVLTDTENFIDVGAYDGRVLLRLLEITGNRLSSALLIEPDIKNLVLLNDSLLELPLELRAKIHVLPVVLTNTDGQVPFSHGFDIASRVCDINPTPTTSVKLDDLDVSPSFIKMHIEGGEYDALCGSLQTLKKYRPIITVTIYHNRDGLWKIPLYLIKSLNEYDFYFRLHSWCGTGAVIYALPKHRK